MKRSWTSALDKVTLETTTGYSALYELKRGPGAVKLDSLLTEIAKLETIEALELPANLFAGVSPRVMESYRQRVAVEASGGVGGQVGHSV